jgi:hypothetical protein
MVSPGVLMRIRVRTSDKIFKDMQVYDLWGYIGKIVATRIRFYADRNPVSSILYGSV